MEPNSTVVAMEISSLFSKICSRQPRALQICARLLDHVSNSVGTSDSSIVKERANIYVLQGQYNSAIKAFREASKKDISSMTSLEGMILCQIYESQLDDAEAQVELLLAMHSEEELSPQFKYIQALLSLRRGRNLTQHESYLNEAKDLLLRNYEKALSGWIEPLKELIVFNPDFVLQVR